MQTGEVPPESSGCFSIQRSEAELPRNPRRLPARRGRGASGAWLKKQGALSAHCSWAPTHRRASLKGMNTPPSSRARRSSRKVGPGVCLVNGARALPASTVGGQPMTDVPQQDLLRQFLDALREGSIPFDTSLLAKSPIALRSGERLAFVCYDAALKEPHDVDKGDLVLDDPAVRLPRPEAHDRCGPLRDHWRRALRRRGGHPPSRQGADGDVNDGRKGEHSSAEKVNPGTLS